MLENEVSGNPRRGKSEVWRFNVFENQMVSEKSEDDDNGYEEGG